MRKILLVGISTFALGAGAMAYANQQTKAPKADTYKMLELFGDVLATVEQQYVVPVDDKKLIQAAIDGLPEVQRMAIVLRRYDEFSYEEIAATLNVKVGTVRSRIHYALRALRLALQERGVTQ